MKKIKENKRFLIILLLCISICLFSVCFYLLESDYLWHIKAGEYMFKNGILKKDVFSWYVKSKYWMSHEWLFELFIYSLKVLFGKMHTFIYCFITILSMGLLLYLSNIKNYLKNSIFTIIWICCFILVFPFVQVRPHLISYNLLIITVWFLYDLYKNEDSKKIYFLPLITILWSNFHGGSSNLVYLLCLLFIIGGLFKFKFNKIEANKLSKKQLIKYSVIIFICIICVCINIHGIKMLFYPYENMLDSTMINNITEWKGTTLNSGSGYIYYGFLLFIVGILLFSKKKIQLMDLLLFLFVAYLGIKSIRFWFYTYIVMSYVVFNYIDSREDDKGTGLCIMTISILLCLIFVFKVYDVYNVSDNYLVNDKTINIIKKENPKRLFNMYNYGGDLVYNDIPVFIDGRADLYSKYNYKDYIDISLLRRDTPKLINKYKFDYFLVDKNYPIYVYINSNKNYSMIYQNNKYAFYKKINN